MLRWIDRSHSGVLGMKIARKKRGRIFKELRIYFAVILLLAVLGAAFHAVLRQALLKAGNQGAPPGGAPAS